MKKIGYFPIKETETTEIMKMLMAYTKKDYTNSTEMLELKRIWEVYL